MAAALLTTTYEINCRVEGKADLKLGALEVAFEIKQCNRKWLTLKLVKM